MAKPGCEMCKGKGHDHPVCPTRKKFDAFAKANGCAWLWGAAKGAMYYTKWRELNPV